MGKSHYMPGGFEDHLGKDIFHRLENGKRKCAFVITVLGMIFFTNDISFVVWKRSSMSRRNGFNAIGNIRDSILVSGSASSHCGKRRLPTKHRE
jgi:hypothetical protein